MWEAIQRDKINIYGVLNILYGKETIPSDGADSYTSDKEYLRRKNDEVCSDLILLVQDQTCFGFISSAKMNELKEVDSSLTWSKLNNRFDNKSRSTKLQVLKNTLIVN